MYANHTFLQPPSVLQAVCSVLNGVALLQSTPERQHVWQESWIRGRSNLLRSILLYLSRVADFRRKAGAELSQAKLVVSFEDATTTQLVQDQLHKPVMTVLEHWTCVLSRRRS